MELKKVNQETSRMYAKKDEITNKEMKKFTPSKWLTASAAGLVTLMYSSPSGSAHKIGVVFGCIEIGGGITYNYSTTWYTINNIMDAFYYLSWVLGVSFVLFFIHHIIKEKKYDESQRIKSVKHIKIVATLLIFSIIVTSVLVYMLKLDISIFYLNGIKKAI